MSDVRYLYPSKTFAVNWPGHTGLWLHNATRTEIRILDPHDCVDGKYRVMDTFPNNEQVKA